MRGSSEEVAGAIRRPSLDEEDVVESDRSSVTPGKDQQDLQDHVHRVDSGRACEHVGQVQQQPCKAAAPVNSPRMRATPMRISPRETNFAIHEALGTTKLWRKAAHQP